jgi:hypothetical protein
MTEARDGAGPPMAASLRGYDRRHGSEGAPHRREPFERGRFPDVFGRTKGGLKLKLDPIYDGRDHPFVIRLCEGPMSGYKSGALTLPVLPG